MSVLKAMTFNIHHGKGTDGKINLKRIIAEISKAEADIVALQEVDRFQSRSFFRDQIAIIAKSLGMFFSYAPSINLGFCQYGNAILSKWPIESKSICYMNGGVERRSILIAHIKVKELSNSGQQENNLTVVNTHIGVRAQEQEWQMPILCHEIAKLSKPALVLGDFNMEPSNPFLKLMDPLWQKICLNKPQATMQNGKQIDHVFTNSGSINAQAWVQETISSDHHAVVANLPQLLNR
jgi:endonuclease/exonuclease/phosphatase family metal-dependent hydrolase